MALQASQTGLEWYRASRFGMFIHWGLYALLGRGEWVMHTDDITVGAYEKLAAQFNPIKFNADEWVSLAADAGQKWITITSRHHDGFSMYDTALSEYKITRTPFARDPLRELADACARRNVKLGFYISLLDWHHPAYRFRAESKLAWRDYIGFLHGQTRELCTQYGEVCQIWFDGDWPQQMHQHPDYFRAGGLFEYDKLYDLVHTLQPHCLIHNNRHAAPISGEDVQGFEQDLPGSNTAGFNTTEIYGLPIETCMTMNSDTWGYSHSDASLKSSAFLVHVLARLSAVGSNFLLNVGPTAEGEIPALQARRLREVGAWLRVNGASIYDTQPGIASVSADLASTRRGDTHYIHSLHDVNDAVEIESNDPAVNLGALRASLLRDGTPLKSSLKVINGKLRLRVILPPHLRDAIDTVIVLQ